MVDLVLALDMLVVVRRGMGCGVVRLIGFLWEGEGRYGGEWDGRCRSPAFRFAMGLLRSVRGRSGVEF